MSQLEEYASGVSPSVVGVRGAVHVCTRESVGFEERQRAVLRVLSGGAALAGCWHCLAGQIVAALDATEGAGRSA